MAENNGTLRGFIAGLFAGGVIGASLALLYAPKSGKEFRADLKEKADHLIEDADEYLQAAQAKAGQIVSEAKKRSDQLISNAKQKADTLLVDAEKVISDAKEKAGPVLKEGARLSGAVKAGVDTYKEERRRT
jgi:gas vesicle protein